MAEIIGTDKNDVLEGSPDPDTIEGLDGNDSLYGDAGADTLLGGKGDDLYYVDSLEDTIVELPGEGKDTVSSSITFVLGDNFENLTLTGGTPINATGNSLDNILLGNDGGNILTGGDGNDDLYGGGGSDTLIGGSGHDKMMGGSGDDYYVVTEADDNIMDDPGGGEDTVFASVSIDLDKTHVENLILAEGSEGANGFGNELNNTLLGNSNDNVLGGREGNDILDGGAGADDMRGGAGDDIFYVDNAGDVVSDSVEKQGGVDTVYSTVSFTLPAEVEILMLTGDDAINGTGNQYSNILVGNDADNVLNGKDNDDYIDGGLGADTLIGEDGDDYFFVDNPGDTVVETANQGIDTVFSSIDYTLGQDVENLVLLDGGLTGTGNSANNGMYSSTGLDTLAGLAGDDSYYVQNQGDVTIEQAGEGTDTVFSEADNYTLSEHIENLTLAGTGAFNGNGNGLDNILAGNSGANILDGAGGNDTMAGNAGDDIYYVDSSGDTVIEGSGQGMDTVKSSISYKLVIEVENLTLIGSDDIDGTGNALANTLTGNDGDNVLIAGTGKDKALDTLNGGLGADTLYGGKSKGDVFVFDSALGNGNVDTLADFKKDYIALDAGIFDSLTAGDLANGNFVSGKGVVAADSNDFILHDTSTGLLYYDADGSGAGEAVAFAEVSGKLSAASFTVFDSAT